MSEKPTKSEAEEPVAEPLAVQVRRELGERFDKLAQQVGEARVAGRLQEACNQAAREVPTPGELQTLVAAAKFCHLCGSSAGQELTDKIIAATRIPKSA